MQQRQLPLQTQITAPSHAHNPVLIGQTILKQNQ